MSVNLDTKYNPAFYARFADESSRSALACVPLIMDRLGPRSVVDFGCGIGQWLSVFAAHGVADYLGIDGPHIRKDQLHIEQERFMAHDFTRPLSLGRCFDLALSLEVGEHLERGRAAAFVELLTSAAPAVAFSAAIPGQGGIGHVNEQWPWYWREMFAARGFVQLDPFRQALWRNPNVASYYQQNLFLYVDPAVHQSLIDQIGVPGKYNELTLVRTSILQELTGPGPMTRFLNRIGTRLGKLFSRHQLNRPGKSRS
jgi:SAM-dependent methyltransferase